MSVNFDEARGVIAVMYALAPPMNLRSTLACALTADEARRLADALRAFADARP